MRESNGRLWSNPWMSIRHGVKLVAFGIMFVAVVAAVGTFTGKPSFQIVGHLSATDVNQVGRLVRHEMRSHLIPYLNWDWDCPRYYGRRPMELLRDIKDYRAQKILWGEAHSDGSVTVFIGLNKSTIRREGYSVSVRKDRGKWELSEVGEFGIWSQWVGGPNVMTSNLHVPPAP